MTRRPVRAAAALVAAAALAGCGSSERHARTDPPAIPLATFTCAQWHASPPSVRNQVLTELHGFYGGPVSGKRRTEAYGTVLSDARATQLFDSYCRQPYATNFTLYKLYARAAGFSGTAP